MILLHVGVIEGQLFLWGEVLHEDQSVNEPDALLDLPFAAKAKRLVSAVAEVGVRHFAIKSRPSIHSFLPKMVNLFPQVHQLQTLSLMIMSQFSIRGAH